MPKFKVYTLIRLMCVGALLERLCRLNLALVVYLRPAEFLKEVKAGGVLSRCQLLSSRKIPK